MQLTSSRTDEGKATTKEISTLVKEAVREVYDERAHTRRSGPPRSARRSSEVNFVLLLVGVAIGYVLRARYGPIGNLTAGTTNRIQRVKDEAAEQTEQMTDQAADRVRKSGHRVTDRAEQASKDSAERLKAAGQQVDETSERLGDRIEKGGEEAGEQIESKSEQAADQIEESGEDDRMKEADDSNRSEQR